MFNYVCLSFLKKLKKTAEARRIHVEVNFELTAQRKERKI